MANTNNFRNLNDSLGEYTGTEQYYKLNFGFVCTDGVKALCENFETTCWWVIDVIISYQYKLKGEEFQQWKVRKNDNESATVTCDDGNDKILIKQEIPFTDISGHCTIWVENNILYLPSER